MSTILSSFKGGIELIIADITVRASSANAKVYDCLPVGASGLKVRFQFVEPAWTNLSKTVVFRNRNNTYDVNIMGNCATIPHEVLAKAMDDVDVGVYGTNSNNTVAIPTVWAKLGTVMSGARPSGNLSKEATLPYWVQIKEQVDVIQKNMMDQEDLENALNRAKESGEFDGPRGEKGEKGDAGPKGDVGPVGPAGAMPEKGIDYFTDADKRELAEIVLTILPVWEGGSY